MNGAEIIIVGSFLAACVLVVYFITKFNYLIKKSILENGGNLAEKRHSTNLELGCILLSLGIGLAISSIYTVLNLSEDLMDFLIFGTLLIFGGLGFVCSYYIRKSNDKTH